jgi:LPXTG-site transpeptidase (sortase) family protein
MHRNISFKWSVLIVGIAGVIFLLSVVFLPALDLPLHTAYAELTSQTVDHAPPKLVDVRLLESLQNIALGKPARPGFPIRLTIPKIKLDAAFEHVGLTPENAMDNPKSPLSVGWYSLGPRPGESGNAVIAGHYGWKNGRPAVFDNVHKLLNGDKIYVEDEKGVTTTFVIREIRSYGENENATSVFVSEDEKVHLNLITCQGIWNKAKKSYSDRLVIFTDKVI